MPKTKTPNFKKGDQVNFMITHSRKIASGQVVATVKAGEKPDFTKKTFDGLHKRGLSQALPRNIKTYLISDGVQLYWPKKVFPM